MWPFRKKAPVPPPVIHPNDVDLVGPADYRWWAGQTMENINSLQSLDQPFTFAAFKKFKARGMSADEAAKEVRRWFPYYYLRLEDRLNDPVNGSEEDRLLPIVIRDRIDRARTRPIILARLKEELPQSTSANAWYRAAIRRNQI
jgi:hypothetical protein